MRVTDMNERPGSITRLMRSRLGCGLRRLVLGISVPFAVGAAPGDPAIELVLRKAQALLRQLSEEKLAWEAERTKLLAEQKDLQTSLAQLGPATKRLQAELAQYRAEADRLRAEKSAAEGEIGRVRSLAVQVQRALREHQQQLDLVESDNGLLISAVEERERWIDECRSRNRKLSVISRELLGRYEEKGLLEEFADAEPLTGIGRVETENVAQDYRFKLEDLKVPPPPATVTQEAAARATGSGSKAATSAAEPADRDEDDED